MRIGLIDIEPKIFNTAYMQIASFHKQRGDYVGWYESFIAEDFDKVYCSSIFDFSFKGSVPIVAVCGGTGFEVSSKLPSAIERCDYDYSLYPKCDRSYIWLSRGCCRKCPWCVVPKKEGKIKPVEPKNINPNGKYIVINDNNFFANPEWSEAVLWLQRTKQPVDFQGVDARIMTVEMCEALNSLRHHKQIKIAWDEPKENMTEHINRITKIIKPYKIMCYVLIGFNSTPEEDLYRVEKLRELKIDPFVMPYNKKDLYQKSFTRWVNYKAIFRKVKWEDYYRRVELQEQSGNGWKT